MLLHDVKEFGKKGDVLSVKRKRLFTKDLSPKSFFPFLSSISFLSSLSFFSSFFSFSFFFFSFLFFSSSFSFASFSSFFLSFFFLFNTGGTARLQLIPFGLASYATQHVVLQHARIGEASSLLLVLFVFV